MIHLKQYIYENINDNWENCVKKIGKWYQDNINDFLSYNKKNSIKSRTRKDYYCDIIKCNVKNDCIGFVMACLKAFKVIPLEFKNIEVNDLFYDIENNGPLYKKLKDKNFEVLEYNKNILKPFDIITCNELYEYINTDNIGTDKNNLNDNIGRQAHIEIYAGNNMSYGWGHVSNNKDGNLGLPCPMAIRKYKYIIRYNG